MANNEQFTTRSGKQVPIPEISLPKDVMVSVMRLREDYAMRGQSLSLTGCVLEMLSKGNDTIRAHWKAAAKNKELRDTGKAVKEYIRIQLVLHKPIDPLEIARLSGMEIPNGQAKIQEELIDDSTIEGDGSLDIESADLTDEQLEQATSPNGLAS